MKAIKLFVLVGFVSVLFVLSGCVNDSLLAASNAYYRSTSSYLELVADKMESVNEEEANLIRKTVSEFGKTLDKYNSEKSWYEF